jgi:electron-transferring-flavoprotein dehydrogenase
LKQLANAADKEISVCILEKGSEIGAHILSGAVIDPKALDELLPEWRESGCPLAEVPVTDNQHWVPDQGRQVFDAPYLHTQVHAQ